MCRRAVEEKRGEKKLKREPLTRRKRKKERRIRGLCGSDSKRISTGRRRPQESMQDPHLACGFRRASAWNSKVLFACKRKQSYHIQQTDPCEVYRQTGGQKMLKNTKKNQVYVHHKCPRKRRTFSGLVPRTSFCSSELDSFQKLDLKKPHSQSDLKTAFSVTVIRDLQSSPLQTSGCSGSLPSLTNKQKEMEKEKCCRFSLLP